MRIDWDLLILKIKETHGFVCKGVYSVQFVMWNNEQWGPIVLGNKEYYILN